MMAKKSVYGNVDGRERTVTQDTTRSIPGGLAAYNEGQNA